VLARLLTALNASVAWLLIAAVCAYQAVLSPLLGGACRFRPTCSTYFVEAVRKYGPWRGGWKGVCRLARCHPFHAGGDDPP
jgi:putative membrane protein insertion efficiency factor